MHGAVRLMSTSNRRILTYVVFWSLVNSVCVFSQVLNKDFGIQLYEKNLTWLTCPEGWSKVGSTCVLVLAELATFTQADSLCQSNGGRLLRVEGFNQNQQYGTLIENVQYQQRDQFLSLGGWDGNSFWIGMYRDGGGQYHWADGQVTKEEQGFWTLDQPLGFQQGHKLCSSIDVKHVSDFGKYRWSLRPCEEKLPIVCQTVTCAEQQYRCQGDSKCISADWLCDGIADCLDQSDERNCSGYCGNTYQGQQGTFQSPNYPHHYPSSSSCQWNIHTPLGTRVYLEFDDFNLENNYDVVSIYDGHSTLDPLVGNFSGGRLPIIPISSSNSLLVQFHSDQDNQSTGFNATWFAVDIQGCGGSLNATSQNQWLTSPGYNSGQYVHNLLCDWILSAPQDLITLQFEDISLRAGDWVEVRDGSTEDAPLFGRYTGDTLTPVIISTGQHLFVRFTSDEESIGKGFNASFKAGCNDIMINKEAAIISSPGYKLGSSFSYPPNLQCSWHLSNPTHTEVAIIFDDNFDTEVDFDVLTIINSSSVQETGAMMQRFSGTKAPPVLRSLKGHFNISFTSDDLVSRPGWRAVISPDCPALHNLSDSMHISSMEREYGTVVKFTCDTGYLLEGATNLICDIKGTWSNSPPVCKKINCGSPSVPENGGIVTSNSSYYTGVVHYRCDVGYHSGDNLISRCQKNGQWSSAPKCEKITCPKIGNLQNGSITTDFDNTFGQKVSFQCNGNYRLVNASEIICGEDGQWSTLKPHCAPPLCPYLPIANGNTSVLQPEGGSWVQVHCKPGYRLLGSQRVWCNLDGTYQSNIPTCADVNECEDKDLCYPHMCQNMMGSYKCRCSHGYQKLNETSNECIDVDECERPGICHHHCNNTEGSYVCECDPGYKLYQGGEAIVVDQRVIIPNKTCIVTCPAFNVSNGGRIFANTTKLSDESYIYPTSLFIYCPYGTLPLWNATTVFCQANGTWSHNIDHCTDQVCEALESPVNGMVYYDSPVLQLGTIATYNCSEGYVLLGTPQRQCMSNGRATLWESGLSNSNFTYCRPRMCVMPAKPLNGFVNYTDLSVGSTATYSCKCGYELIGSKVIHCQGNGVWSGNGTICVDKDCSTPIPPTNGGVYSSTRMYYFGSRISYTCQKGYSLIGSPDSTCSLPEQTSPPELLLLLFVTFKGDNNINDGCASQYRTQMAAKFNESVRRLPSCAVLGMYVLDSSRENSVSGSQITIGTSINLSGSPSAMCNCSEDIVRSTPSSMNWEIIVDSCPTLANKNTPEKKFQERVQDWKCPTDFILEGGAGDCAYNETPICRKATDCLDSEDPNEITSTISTSKLPLSSQATSTISSTSPDASHWTESTSSVASVVTQSTLGNILSTLSTTHTPQQGTTASNSDTNSPGISDHTADIPTITTPSEATQITTPKSEQQTTTQLHSTTVTNKATDFTVMKTDSLLSTSDAATTTKATTMAKVSTTSTSSVTESMVTEEPTSGTTSLEPSEATSTAIKTSSTVAPTVDEISSTIEALATEKTSTTTEKTTTTTSKVQTPTMEVSTIAPVGTEKTTVKSPMTTKDTTVTTNVPYSVAETTSKGQTTVTLRTLSEAETSSTTTGSEFTSKSMTSSELPTTEITAGTSISTYSTEPQSATTEPSTVTRVALPTTTTNQPTPTTQPPSTTTQMKSTTALSINDTTQAHITTSELSGTTTQYRTPTTQSLLNSTVTEEQMTTQMLTEESTQSVPPQTATAVSETTTKQTESTITEIQTTPTQTTTTNLETTPTTDSTTTTAKATITTPQVTTTVDQGTTSEAKTTISQFDTTTVTQVSNTQPKVTFLRSTTTQPQTTTLESQVTTTTTQFTNAQNEASTSQPQTTTTDQQTTTTTTQAGITQPLATTTNAYKTTAEPQMTTTTTQFTTTQHEATTTTSQTTTKTKQSSTTQLQPSSSDQQTTSLTTLATTTESQATTTEPKIATTITQADATTTPKPQTTTTTNQSTTLNPQTTSMEKLTSTTRIQATTTQQDTTTTEQQITTRSQSTILPQTYTTEPQPTMTNRETTTTEKQTITTTSQPLTELPQTTTTKRHTTSTEQQTTTTVQSTTENLETSTTQQQIAPTTTQSTTTQKPTTSTEQLTTTTDKPESTTIEQQTTTTTTQSSTRQPEITTTKLLTAATEKPETSTTEQQTTTTQSTTTQPQLNTMLQTSTTDQQTTTTTPQFTTQLHTTSTVTPSITQPQTTTTEQHTTTTTTESTMQPQTTTIIQSTTQPQATISKHKTTSTTPQSTTQSQTTTTEQQTTTKTTQSTTQPQTTTSEQQTTTTTPQSITQPKPTTTKQQTTTTRTQSTTQPQTTTFEQQTTTTTPQSTTQQQTTTTTPQSTTQPKTTTTEQQITTTRTQSTSQPQTTTSEQQTTTTTHQSTTQQQTTTTTPQSTTQPKTTTTEQQTTTTRTQSTTQPQTTTSEQQTTTTTPQSTTQQQTTTTTPQSTTQPKTTTTEQQTTTTRTQSTIQPQTTITEQQTTTRTPQSTTQQQPTTTEQQTTTTTPQSTTQPQTTNSEQQTTTTKPQFTTQQQTTTTTPQSTTQPKTTTTEQQTTITTTQLTTQPQTTTTEQQTTTTTPQSTTQQQTTTTEQQTTTTTPRSTTQPQSTTSEQQTTTTTPQSTTQQQPTTTEQQTTTTTPQSTTQPQTTTTEQQTTTTRTQSTTQPQTTTTTTQSTTQPQTTTEPQTTTTEALIAETTTPGTTLASSMYPLHYGTYWTYTHPANEDTSCQQEMATAYQTAFDESKVAIENAVKSQKKSICPSDIILTITYDRPPIFDPSQEFVFVLKIGFTGNKSTMEKCAAQVNSTINSKVESLFDFNPLPCPSVYPLTDRTLSKRSEWICSSQAYRYDTNQHMCVLRLSSAASFVATRLSDQELDVVTEMIPQIPPTTNVQPHLYSTTTTTTSTTTTTTYVPSSTRTPVEPDQTPFFVNEVFFKFQAYNLTENCLDTLKQNFQNSVDQASSAIRMVLPQLSSCQHITDAELINRKSTFSHDTMSPLNQMILTVPFILRTRKYPHHDMESCINASIKSLLEVGFVTNISNLIKAIPRSMCHRIELIETRYTMDIQCPSPYRYDHSAKRCYTVPLLYMPTRFYLMEITLSLTSRGGTQCNTSYSRSIRRQLETQNVSMLKNGLYDICLMYNVVVKINPKMSNLTRFEEGVRGIVGIVLMATSENPNYNECVGSELYKYIFSTDLVPGTQIIPTDNPRECGNLTWEENQVIGMVDNTCLGGYFKFEPLNRCIEERSAELRANYTPNIAWKSTPSHDCLSSLAHQMENFMNIAINATRSSANCSQMYQIVRSRPDPINNSVNLELSILPFQWDENGSIACLRENNKQLIREQFNQDNATSCPLYQGNISINIKSFDFKCIRSNYYWNKTTRSCVKGLKRKKRSRAWQKSPTKSQSLGEGGELGKRGRQKRSVAQNPGEEEVASWLPEAPLCQDHQPPVFNACPEVLNISMGRLGPIPFDFSLPQATDNSGVPPSLSYSPADIVRQPYLLKNETQIVITAKDQSNNIKNCTIQLSQVDDIPPDMTCPDSVVVEKYSTLSNQTNITLSNWATAWDYSGIHNNRISYQIGYNLPVRHFTNVTATANDTLGNRGSCHFLYEAKRADLNADGNVALNFSYSLERPSATCKNKTFTLISNDVLSIANNSCIISAELYLGYQFELRAQKVEQSFMYTVQVLLKRTNKGKVDKQDSFELNLHVIQLNVHKEKFHQCMDNFTQQMIDKYQSGYDLRDSGCGEVNISLAASKSAIICPHDSVLNESTVTCSQCDLGYYANQTSQSCQRCPSLESEIIIHGDCKLCNSNLNTVSCLKPCQPGEYSENGLQPCVRCPRGQYTPNTGARVCEHCQEGHYTEKTGALQCKAKCPAGQYSDTGLHPCRNCPWNHYSSTEMSTACSPCPIGQVTDAPGKSSITDCQEIDFCASNPSPCQNGGTCQRKLSDNWYSCDCPSGYHGYHCENRYNVCDSEPCLNGATCIDQSNRPVCQCPTGYTGDFCEVPMSPCSCVHGHCRANADGYYCSCFTGYAGPNCSEDIDECSPNPCLHGGRCMNLIGQYQCDCSETGYDGVNCTIPGSEVSQTVCFNWGVYIEASKSCSCRQGYSGAHCQNLVDECQDNFCGENGDCIDEINNFTCVCKPGFTGRYCNINISECSASPCRNGTCIPGNNNFSCVCQAGFEGKQCEINRDECSPFPCNLTTAIDCRDGVNDYTCVCREGYTGKWCQNRSHSCPVQCQNGGSCNGEALRCDCMAGYTGPYCEVELNECAGQPCLNGGTCTDRINSFNCSCPLGYTGATCDVNINECSSNPCQNGGTCLDLVNRFICSCPSSFTGSDCSQKISLCSSLPCENGAECMDSKLHGYLCSCPSGYNGQNCSDIVTCDSSPCHNGGSCTQEENNFTCSCALGFTGRTCDTPQDPCLLGNVCRNGATCVNGTCLCTPFFTGFDCGKVKSSDFDLFFHGLNGSSSSLWISVEQEMSVCLWIRPINTRKNKSVLTLAVNDTATGKVLEVKERNYSVTYPPKTWYGSFPLNNGLWNHVCFTWTQTNFWSLYLNGSIIRRDKDMLLPNRVMILLGQPLTSEPGQTQFYGEISQLQVFPKQLTENDISSLSKSCNSATESHNSWLELLANIMGDVRVIEPSACGGQRCPAGYKGHNCSIKVNKNPPVVHGCPSDFRVVSSNRLNKVNWTEPTFSDDVGVVNVYQTHRSGEVMTYGEYSVKYWAFDSANNTANCSFRVAVTPFDCEIPEVPAGVTHSCQRGGDGSYCRLSCTDPDTHAFSESVPQFYKCGLSGLWDPPRGENFTFPACAAFSPPAAGVTGTISFTGPLCTNNLKDRLVLIFNQTMAKWNQEYGLCPDQVCNLMVRIHCSGDITLRRRRRQAPDTSYLVRFNFPVNKTSLETTSLQPLDSIKTYVKKGEFNTDGFVAKNDSVIVTTQCNCLDGQILQQVGTTEHCVNCAMGSFHNKNESTCDLCPVGFYNDQERQTACTSCPEGQTTQDPGAQHISQCYTICPAGQYAEDVTNVCKKCPRGYYQELTGRRMCQSCPSGLMTLQEGATTLEQCQAGCLEGQELSVWGTCVPCQQGFYKGQSSLASCQACPYGTTTSTTGSTSIDKCYIVVCAAGSYTSDNQCFPCPLGQYQPQRGQSQCLQCPVGQTTLLEGSVRPSDCVEGNVNECLTNVAKCGPNEDCKDTLESYRCDCKEGYTQQENGNCTVLEEKTPISTQRDDKTWTIVGSTVGAGLVVLVIVVIILILHCRKDENECLRHEAELYRQNQVVVLPMRPAPVFSNRTFASSRSSSLSLQGSDLEMSPAEMDLLPPSWPDEPLNISDSSENGSTEGAPSSSSGFDVNSDSYF